ncbi:MAG: hypothetical protein ABSA57_17815 [Candidatus Acidiferrales bacterium]
MNIRRGCRPSRLPAAVGWVFLLVALPCSAQYRQEPALLDPLAGQPQSQEQPATPSHPADKNGQVDKDSGKDKNDRMFFVMPNFLTVENESQVAPISWKEKFAITAKGAFDPYEFAVVGILAGVRQAENAYPGFGQGFEGYGKRYGTGFADQVDGNIMVGAVFPTILRTDPRYFQLGKGRFLYRFGYAMSRILITRRDSGGRLFNFAEFAGNATAIAISNLYYPPADRGFSASANNWGVQMGIDALGNELKEFWPDIHRHLPKKKGPVTAAGNSPAD